MNRIDFYQQKNIEFYDFLNESFNIRKAHKWSDISNSITKAKISATYKFFSKLFPQNIDYSSKFESNSNTFKSLHYNKLDANKIINEVVRYSLYSDEIFVFHPIQNPSITNQRLNPIKNPQIWLQNFLDSLYFYIVLQKWVRAGIVKLIINPYEYDFGLRDKLDKEAEKRVNSILSNSEFKKIASADVIEDMAELLAQSYSRKSIFEIKQGLLEMTKPRFNEQDAELLAQEIFSKQKTINPLYDKLNVPFGQNSIVTVRGGGNLESISYIAKLLKGNIYTTNETNWHQIKQLDNLDNWTKIAYLYSKIEMPFLDGVDTSFALDIRKEDRLAGVRKELRKIYNSINTIQNNEFDENKLIELNGGFIEELKKAEAEWSFIKKAALNNRRYWAASTLGLPVVFNEVSILPFVLGHSILLLGKNIYDEKLNENRFKTSCPLSVYVDLKHIEPGFFSELKNCIF